MPIEILSGWEIAAVVQPLPPDGASLVVAHPGVVVKPAPPLVVGAKTGLWRQIGARLEVTSDRVCPCLCVGFAMVELELEAVRVMTGVVWPFSPIVHPD